MRVIDGSPADDAQRHKRARIAAKEKSGIPLDFDEIQFKEAYDSGKELPPVGADEAALHASLSFQAKILTLLFTRETAIEKNLIEDFRARSEDAKAQLADLRTQRQLEITALKEERAALQKEKEELREMRKLELQAIKDEKADLREQWKLEISAYDKRDGRDNERMRLLLDASKDQVKELRESCVAAYALITNLINSARDWDNDRIELLSRLRDVMLQMPEPWHKQVGEVLDLIEQRAPKMLQGALRLAQLKAALANGGINAAAEVMK